MGARRPRRGLRKTKASADPSRRTQPPQGLQSPIKPTRAEILAAIESLYADQLKPFGRILRKRIAERTSGHAAERATASDEAEGEPSKRLLPDVDSAHLRLTCDGWDELLVEPEE